MKPQTSLISFMYDLYALKVQQHLQKVFTAHSGCHDMDVLVRGKSGYTIEHRGSRKKEWIYVSYKNKPIGEVMCNEIRFDNKDHDRLVLVTKYMEAKDYGQKETFGHDQVD